MSDAARRTWTGETWLVLGASSPVARAFARRAAAGGADILLAGRDLEDLERTGADIWIRSGRRAEVLPFDAARTVDHQAFAAKCVSKASLLNAFVAFGLMPSQESMDREFELVEQTIAANYVGAVSVLARLAPQFEAQRRGCIVVLTSVAGERGRLKNYVYGSAKAGLAIYLQGLRARLDRHGVAVTTVKAGFLDTSMTFGQSGLFLVASPDACASACLRAAAHRRDVIYYPVFWGWIMAAIRAIPERLAKRLSF